ncbi:hypothetical protein [Polynucleobacter sp. UK-Kesae-W10]|uniref:hypothetical protein n=1 Tax=Polynucleobacter sp. UK-Kesae-W10 TaxID=1819738 RepID=UPI001C0D2F98|nr:hypothetical protein [Polynucleobacter sp. UK-Kesae-W10]MBU3577601.1 hypothetical protein [Polynucleobacter sp. UK-Kesae-W10]
MSQILEVMTTGGESRSLYDMRSAEAKAIMDEVEKIFGPQNWAGYISIGNSVSNSAMGSRIITAVCGVIPHYLYDIGARGAERKFHMDTGFMYDKMYTFAPSADQLPVLPPSAKAIAIGFNHCIAGRGGDPKVENVWDVYFSADPDECESFFNLDKKRGLYSTLYGVTYDHQTKEVLRVKVYTYDNNAGHSDWDGALAEALATM